jgi:hypothetical protein
MSSIDIARALKDQDYFNSLSPEDRETVRNSAGIGSGDLTDESLETVSGGLEGNAALLATTTTGEGTCSCQAASSVVCTC